MNENALSAQAQENLRLDNSRHVLLARLNRREISIDFFREEAKKYELTTSAPEAEAHRAMLMSLIEGYLKGELSFTQFSEAYLHYYSVQLPGYLFADADLMQFAEISERLQWTAEHPSADEIAAGWNSPGDFFDWLRTYRRERLPS